MCSTNITMKTSGKFFIVLLIISFALAGCQEVSATPSPQPTATRTAIPATATPTMPKKIVTVTLRTTFTPSKTPAPTLSSEQISTQISDYLQNNGGCDLPCWWGIVPGETSWETAESILAPIASNRFGWKTGKDFEAAFYFQYIPNADQPGLYDLWVNLQIKENVIALISIGNIENLSMYYISELLKTYGKPDEVWMFTSNGDNNPQFTDPFVDILLFYYKQGFMAYYSNYGTLTNDIIHVCFQESGFMDLWRPGDVNTITDYGILFEVATDLVTIRRPLDEVTELNMDRFFNIFTSNDNPCLEIDQKIWPTPNW